MTHLNMDYTAAEAFMLNKLKGELKPELYYHCYHHTLDVYDSTLMLAGMEKVNGKELILLKTAAIFHDAGFIIDYNDHEGHSVTLARKYLPSFRYSPEDIEIICRMIYATKLPQSPHNLLEKILCDADLDYLGREDFFMTANKLLCEWNHNGISTSLKKWYHIQFDFLSSNNYFTKSAICLRRKKKNKNLSQIKELLITKIN